MPKFHVLLRKKKKKKKRAGSSSRACVPFQHCHASSTPQLTSLTGWSAPTISTSLLLWPAIWQQSGLGSHGFNKYMLAHVPTGIPLVTFIACALHCILLDLISIWHSWTLPLQSSHLFHQDTISPSFFLHFLPHLLDVFFFLYLPLKPTCSQGTIIGPLLFSIYSTSEIFSISMVSIVIIYLILIILYIQLHSGHIHQRTFQNPLSQTEI